MKKILMFMFSLQLFAGSCCVVWAGNNAGAAFKAWPDTGQETCYDNSTKLNTCPNAGENFYGQDAQYQGPIRSYTKLGEGGVELDDGTTTDDGWIMTRDNVTGLIWEIKKQKDGAPNNDDPHDADNTYKWCDQDESTNGGSQGSCSGINTEEFIRQLNATNYGGFSDWRMPTVKELATLMNIADKPADLDGDMQIDPAIDTDYFPDTRGAEYWSATSDMSHDINAWYVCFDRRCIYENKGKNADLFVRAVRGGRKPVVSERFIDNDDCTVTDKISGLMWQKCLMGQYDELTGGCDRDITWDGYYNWSEALQQCSELEFAGHDDWRLPNRNELMSMIDYSSFAPAYDSTVFPNLFSEEGGSCSYNDTPYTLWTSSTSFEYDFWNDNFSPTSAFFMDLCKGTLCKRDKSDAEGKLRTRAVRSIEPDGDHDFDKDIDGTDLANMAYYSKFGNGYDHVCDLNYNRIIDSGDIDAFAQRFGTVEETPAYY